MNQYKQHRLKRVNLNPRKVGELAGNMNHQTVLNWLNDAPQTRRWNIIKIERAISDFEQELLAKRRKLFGITT